MTVEAAMIGSTPVKQMSLIVPEHVQRQKGMTVRMV